MRSLLLLPLYFSVCVAVPQVLHNSNLGQAVVQQQQQLSLTNSQQPAITRNNQGQTSDANYAQQITILLNQLTELIQQAGTKSRNAGTSAPTTRTSNLGPLGQIFKRKNSELDINTTFRFSRLNNGTTTPGKTREYILRFNSNPQGRSTELNNRRYK